MTRVIFHVDMDAFFAAVEQRDRPALKGQPVIVGGLGQRGVVSTASYEARPFGVHSALPMAKARQLCPHAHFISPRMHAYSDASRIIMSTFADFTPLVEPLSVDEAFLDMSGTEKLFGSPQSTAQQIKRAVFEKTQLTCSIGIAPNKFLAKLCSDMNKPAGVTNILNQDIETALAPLPLKKLWGVGPKTLEKLQSAGYRTFGHIQQASEEDLIHRFGAHGQKLYALSWGRDERQVSTQSERKSIGSETTFNQDIIGTIQVETHLRRQCIEVAKELRNKKVRAQGVRIKVRYTQGFKTQTAQTKTAVLIQDSSTLFETAVTTLDRFNLNHPIRLVGVAAFALVPETEQSQMSLFNDSETHIKKDKRETMEKLSDDIQRKFGVHTVIE